MTRFIRVLASGVWGYLALLLLKLGITLPPEQESLVQAALFVLFTALANGLVGIGSKKFPWLEWLLGVGVAPTYEKTNVH